LAPLLFEPTPRLPLPPFSRISTSLAGLVFLAFAAIAVTIQTRFEKSNYRTALFLAGAMILANVHIWMVDVHPAAADWQRTLYYDILNAKRDDVDGQYRAPHQFRPLPYGFTRTLELLTHSRPFASFLYRAFFYYWLLWAAFQLARQFHTNARALLTLVP